MTTAITAVSKIVSVLESLDEADKQKVLDAVLTLTGLSAKSVQQRSIGSTAGNQPNNQGQVGATAQQYFESKEPKNKIEELAVAARYLEENEDIEDISRDDFIRVFKAARRNFDKTNYGRDLANAKTRGFSIKVATAD